MIERVVIDNFRCLRHVDVPLKPLTVLVGPNDTGKSSFARACRALSADVPLVAQEVYRLQAGATIKMQAVVTGGAAVRVEHDGNKYRVREGTDSLRPIMLFQFQSVGIPLESPGTHDHVGPPVLGEMGERTAAFLDYLLRRDLKRFNQIASLLKDMVPGFESIQVLTPQPSERRIQLVIDGTTVDSLTVSTGIAYLLAHICIACHPITPKLVIFEEPENGLHPERQREVVGLIRRLVSGTLGGQPTQVIMTTHSPYLLDEIDPRVDQVLCSLREKDGQRTVTPLDMNKVEPFLGEFRLGEIIYNAGETSLAEGAAT